MALVKYLLSKAQRENPLDTASNYIAQRGKIYSKLKNKDVGRFFNTQDLNNVSQQYKVLQSLFKELNSVRITAPTKNFLFNGTSSDAVIINNLLQEAKSLQGAEDFDKYSKILNELENSSRFINSEVKNKTNIGNNVFAIGTQDYEKMKAAILKAKDAKNIEEAKQAAKKYYSGLIGNLGETIGIIQGYKLVSNKLQQQLKENGIDIVVANTGGVVKGSRAIGDTTVSFKLENGEIIGSIAISNKLSSTYNPVKSKPIKIRETFPSYIPDNSARSLYYNLFSLHAKGKQKNLDLYPSRSADIMAFRRYVAALIMEQNLFGAFAGDNVYYFNYGEYLYTMNDLLDYWTAAQSAESASPLASLPGHKKRLELLAGVKKEEEADRVISKQPLVIKYNFHVGNLNNALGIS